MLRIRALADAVIQGAGTARQERIYRKLPPELRDRRLGARARAGTTDGDSVAKAWTYRRDSAVFRRQSPRTVVFRSETSPADRVRQFQAVSNVVVSDQVRPEVGNVVQALRRDFGVRYLLCEGGPTLNRSFFEAGLVDEFFLTFAPKMVAGYAKTVVEGPSFALGDQPKLNFAIHL